MRSRIGSKLYIALYLAKFNLIKTNNKRVLKFNL